MTERGKCKDLMTDNPTCCLPTDGVEKAAQVMKSMNVGPVPIVESLESRKLVGIITDRDIAVHVVAEGRDPRKTTVQDAMSDNVVTCHPDDDVERVLAAMTEYRLRRIPVVDEEGRICGIIAQADVATGLKSPARVGEVLANVSH